MFLPGASAEEPIHLPQEELDKLRRVLRLSRGAEIGVLPNDGTLIRCRLEGHEAVPLEVLRPETEASLRLTICQALPKGDKLDEIVRSCTEIGAAGFIVFPSDRTIVKWDDRKTADRLKRLQVIAREACEMSFRTLLPSVEAVSGLDEALARAPHATVLSESEGHSSQLEVTRPRSDSAMTIVVGPEGGWSSRELRLIGDRGVTLGPRVLRVDHAAAAAAAILLLEHR